ncbi:NEAT domain-containing protein [Sporosarcina sp. Marseille-Q4943]|uniref:NEAT domain-containing protein n=1 Tax=Sporosarcina sp. Marseille-Q4943 TaxID=2942204 RepID=UPI00208DAA6C|nr:NEAT domain-containing protein [Sporosarcina sp. Marseille-Q4943]
MKRHLIVAMTLFLVTALFIPIMPLNASAATFADGEYTVPFTVLKDTSNERSTTADYMVSPAKVQLVNDRATVTVTLKNSSWWQYFKVQNGGSFSDVQVVSESGDQRVVRFTVSDLKQLVNAKIHIIVTGIPGFDYDNKYDIRFNFNTSSIPAPPVAKPVVTPPPAKETKPATPTKTEVKPVQQVVQKPAQKPAENKTDAAKTTESVTKKEEKSVGDETEKDKSEQSATESEEAQAEEDETTIEDEQSEDADMDVALDEMDAAAEEDEVVEEVAIEEVKDEKEKSSNTFLIAIIVIGAIIGAAVVFSIARKRARK